MIVKNEAKVIERCLGCVRSFADEIIVVDTGSKDRTKELASRFTPHVYDFAWCDDFSKARNLSFSHATGDYIMWLDADDVISGEDQSKINQLKQTLAAPDSPDCIMCKYVLSRSPREFYYYRERILRNNFGFVWEEPVHEVITPRGKIIYTDIEIEHKKITPAKPKRNLKIYRKLLREKKTLSPRAQYYYARELMFNGYYRAAITNFNKVLSRLAWVENKIDANINKAQCFIALGESESAKRALVDSFYYGAPRAKSACMLGELLLGEKDYTTASQWFLLATKLTPLTTEWCEPDYYNFIPYVYLSVCHYHLGERDLAIQYHNLAKKIHPEAPEIAYNDKFFE